jgi:hypothetical protein
MALVATSSAGQEDAGKSWDASDGAAATMVRATVRTIKRHHTSRFLDDCFVMGFNPSDERFLFYLQ